MSQIISEAKMEELLNIDTMGRDERKATGINGLSMADKVLLADWWKANFPIECDSPPVEFDGEPINDELLDEFLDGPLSVMGAMRGVAALVRLI